MLASDLNNPEFLGAVNPDDLVQITFYDYKPLDKFKTESPDGQGKKHYKDEKPFVRIEIPGKKDSVIERYATQTDSERWPRQWLNYQMQTGKVPQSNNIPGWRIEDWPEMGEDQARELKFYRFYTVEQIAGCSDSQAQSIMGGFGLRQRAQEAIAARNKSAASEMLAERDAKISGLESKVDQLADMMKQFLQAQGGKPEAPKIPVELDYVETKKIDSGGSGPAREKLGLPKREGATA